MLRKQKIVITLPAYRAAGTLEKTIADIPEGIADLLILVDDASTDETAALARDLGITVHVHKENRGYGGNQKTCYTEALREGGDIVVMLHPDYQYDPKAVPLLIAPILAGDADMTFGSRFAGLGDPRRGGMPLYRYVGNRVTTIVQNILLGSRFTEMHSGLRAYTRTCLLSMPFLAYSDDFDFDAQFMVDAVTGGQRVVEVPIPTRYTKESSSISIIKSLMYVFKGLAYCLQQVAARGRRGRRYPPAMETHPRLVRAPGGRTVLDEICMSCGWKRQILVWRSNAPGAPTPEDYAISGAPRKHDDIVQCPSCGLLWSGLPATRDEIIAGYKASKDTASAETSQQRVRFAETILDVIERYPTRDRRLFDAWAGVGVLANEARRRGWDVTGMEPSAWAVDLARENYDLSLMHGSIEADPIMGEHPLDVAVLTDGLERLVDPVAALARLRSHLDDEGLLILTMLNIDSWYAKVRRDEWPWFRRLNLRYLSPHTLRRLLRSTGFRLVDWTPVDRPDLLASMKPEGGIADGPPERFLGKGSDHVLAVARPI